VRRVSEFNWTRKTDKEKHGGDLHHERNSSVRGYFDLFEAKTSLYGELNKPRLNYAKGSEHLLIDGA
jgi:hypothetical protein